MTYDFTHKQNLRNKTKEHKEKNREGDKPRIRLLTIENKAMVTQGVVGGEMLLIADGN